ncbi:MAG: hypothetical protein M0R48_01640 [Candidatus Omnitrophica bacterium]|jgi:hypothetical protein|nr:hypothetical protein [Candidatus Omnitrophota bacterium]
MIETIKIVKFIFLVFLFICVASTIRAATMVTQDIGLRLRDGVENVPMAVQPVAASTSPLRIYKNGTIYGIKLVPINHPAATKVHIKLPSGQVMAIQRGCGKPWYTNAGLGSLNSTTGVYTFSGGAAGEAKLVNCWTYYACGTSAGSTDCFPAASSCSHNDNWIVSPSSPDGAVAAIQATANMVCQMQGYNRAVSYHSKSWPAYPSYTSPGDNVLAYWNTSSSRWIPVKPANASPVNNYQLQDLKCDCNQP